jgi:hypothetical protein
MQRRSCHFLAACPIASPGSAKTPGVLAGAGSAHTPQSGVKPPFTTVSEAFGTKSVRETCSGHGSACPRTRIRISSFRPGRGSSLCLNTIPSILPNLIGFHFVRPRYRSLEAKDGQRLGNNGLDHLRAGRPCDPHNTMRADQNLPRSSPVACAFMLILVKAIHTA